MAGRSFVSPRYLRTLQTKGKARAVLDQADAFDEKEVANF